MKMNVPALSNEDIRALAPSVFAEKPWEGVSKRYAFIPTISAVDALRDNGFFPVEAQQSKVRIAGKKPFTKHLLRFRHRDDLKGAQKQGEPDPTKYHGGVHFFYKKGTEPEMVEVVLTNSHDRSSAYCLDAGMFRLVCSNGLVIASARFGSIHIYHSGNVVDEVVEGTRSIINAAPGMREQVKRWRAISITPKDQRVLAEAVLIGRYGLDDHDNLQSPIAPESLLARRRDEDAANDLWTVTNVIQENMMKGGMEGLSSNGRRTRTRPVASINTELDVNRNIWATAEVMAERLAA